MTTLDAIAARIDAEADRAKKRGPHRRYHPGDPRPGAAGIHDDLAAKLDAIEAAVDDEQVPA